jgi:hypothetical protein
MLRLEWRATQVLKREQLDEFLVTPQTVYRARFKIAKNEIGFGRSWERS